MLLNPAGGEALCLKSNVLPSSLSPTVTANFMGQLGWAMVPRYWSNVTLDISVRVTFWVCFTFCFVFLSSVIFNFLNEINI